MSKEYLLALWQRADRSTWWAVACGIVMCFYGIYNESLGLIFVHAFGLFGWFCVLNREAQVSFQEETIAFHLKYIETILPLLPESVKTQTEEFFFGEDHDASN